VPIIKVEPEVIARAYAARAQVIGEPGRALVERRVGEAPLTRDQRLALGHRVGHRLEQVGDVEGRSAAHRRHARTSLPTIHIAKYCEPPP
jgi:hypothetical protein